MPRHLNAQQIYGTIYCINMMKSVTPQCFCVCVCITGLLNYWCDSLHFGGEIHRYPMMVTIYFTWCPIKYRSLVISISIQHKKSPRFLIGFTHWSTLWNWLYHFPGKQTTIPFNKVYLYNAYMFTNLIIRLKVELSINDYLSPISQ